MLDGRSNAQKEEDVRKCLLDPKTPEDASDRHVERVAKVSRGVVRRVRTELTREGLLTGKAASTFRYKKGPARYRRDTKPTFEDNI